MIAYGWNPSGTVVRSVRPECVEAPHPLFAGTVPVYAGHGGVPLSPEQSTICGADTATKSGLPEPVRSNVKPSSSWAVMEVGLVVLFRVTVKEVAEKTNVAVPDTELPPLEPLVVYETVIGVASAGVAERASIRAANVPRLTTDLALLIRDTVTDMAAPQDCARQTPEGSAVFSPILPARFEGCRHRASHNQPRRGLLSPAGLRGTPVCDPPALVNEDLDRAWRRT